MKLAIMQPYLFPYLGYFQLIAAVDKFIVFDDVNYINKGWINRNNILLNNAPGLFTIPLASASQNKLIKEINIVEQSQWTNKFFKTIDLAYKKAPHFAEVRNLLERIITYAESNLSVYTTNSIKSICDYLNINTFIEPSSGKYDTNQLKGQDKILKICSLEKARTYVNPIGGRDIYENEKFESSGIKLTFIKMKSLTYNQFKNEFVPNLSIIDVLMFNGKNTIQLLDKFDLISNGEQDL
jgi:hypothetical protein